MAANPQDGCEASVPRRWVTIVAVLLCLAASGCDSHQPEWWRDSPNMGNASSPTAIKRPLLRAIAGAVVVWVPIIVVINWFILRQGAHRDAEFDDFLVFTILPNIWLLHALGLGIFLLVGLVVGALLTALFSLVYFCVGGAEGYVSFQFCVFVAFLLLTIIPLLVAAWFFKSQAASGGEERRKWRGAVIALAVLNAFGFLFTIRDIFGLVASLFG